MKRADLHHKVFFIALFLSLSTPAWAQTRPVVIQGGTLIDGTGRPPLADAVVVFQDGRIRDVGERGKIAIPQGAEVIDAKGKTILPGLIDGHCHFRDWMGEVYLAFGVTTCPNISNSPADWIIAQREGQRQGSIRGPRVWASGNVIDGPPPKGLSAGALRRQRTSIIVENEDEARKAVRDLVAKGVDGIKLFERLTPQAAKAAAEESHRLGKPVIGHTLDIFASAANGYQSVEHSWSVLYTSIQDPKKKSELDFARMTGKVNTAEVHVHMEPEVFGRLIKTMVEKRVHWSPTWATWFRGLSARAAKMKQQEIALLKDPRLRYLPAYILKSVEEHFAMYESASPEKRAQYLDGYRKVQDWVRRFIAAGGKMHLGSDPNSVLPGYAVHIEVEMAADAGITPVQAIRSASLSIAEAWRKEKDYGSVEKGKVADVVIVRGDPLKDISATQQVEMVYMDGKAVDISYHPDYKNPIPRPIEDRPGQ
jgi:hypothetical protein